MNGEKKLLHSAVCCIAIAAALVAVKCLNAQTTGTDESNAGTAATEQSASAGAEGSAPATPPEKAAEASGTKNPPAQLPLIHRPYSVSVELGFDGRDAKNPALRSMLTREIRSGLERMFGHMWSSHVAESQWLLPASAARLQRLKEEDLNERFQGSGVEKVILVAITADEGEFSAGCREYDLRVQEFSPLLEEATNDIQSVANMACRLIRDSFRPVLLFKGPSVDKTELEFEIQAGMLTPPDPTAHQLRDGDVLRTFLRQMDRRNPGKVKLLQKLDLCYVRVTSYNEELRPQALSEEDKNLRVEGIPSTDFEPYTDTGHARGVLIAHGPVPFGGRGRSVEQIGLRQRPAKDSSKVRMVLQARPDRPLICFRVDRVSKLRQTDVNELPGVRMLSDRNGEIEISVDPENPTFWLYVYSGSVLLARVPYAPGLIPYDVMKLPDDSIRLGVEGELYLLRDQLVDMVAQKAVHMSLARKAAAEGNAAGLEESIARLDELPGQKRFEELLNKIKSDAVTKANQQKNSAARRKVEGLCKKMSESLTLFFSADKRIRDAEELEKLRQSAAR